jgi:hypothetical protein
VTSRPVPARARSGRTRIPFHKFHDYLSRRRNGIRHLAEPARTVGRQGPYGTKRRDSRTIGAKHRIGFVAIQMDKLLLLLRFCVECTFAATIIQSVEDHCGPSRLDWIGRAG